MKKVLIVDEEPAEEEIMFMDLEMVTASNRLERISKAPYMVIVITRSDIVNRGYQNIIDILNDLPGMNRVIGIGAYRTAARVGLIRLCLNPAGRSGFHLITYNKQG